MEELRSAIEARPGDDLREVWSAANLRALSEALRALAAGDHIQLGQGLVGSAGNGGFTIALRNQNFRENQHPFEFEPCADGTKAQVRPGRVFLVGMLSAKKPLPTITGYKVEYKQGEEGVSLEDEETPLIDLSTLAQGKYEGFVKGNTSSGELLIVHEDDELPKVEKGEFIVRIFEFVIENQSLLSYNNELKSDIFIPFDGKVETGSSSSDDFPSGPDVPSGPDSSSSSDVVTPPSSHSGPHISSGSSKDTAVVRSPFSPTGYTALATTESPEVLFEDTMTVILTSHRARAQVDPRFLAVIERDTIAIVASGDKPWPLGATVCGETGEICLL
jgi:hypothetical protein